MTTYYYLRRKQPMTVREQTKVLRACGGVTSVWQSDHEGVLVDVSGDEVASVWRSSIPQPRSVDDLRDLLAGGRYDLYDEYGAKVDLKEVLGDAAEE